MNEYFILCSIYSVVNHEVLCVVLRYCMERTNTLYRQEDDVNRTRKISVPSGVARGERGMGKRFLGRKIF